MENLRIVEFGEIIIFLTQINVIGALFFCYFNLPI